ncbi:MAG: rRNA maturation RNase YbeY [Paludibacteraceae bacterium]
MIHFITENIDMPFFNQERVILWIKRVARQYDKKTGNINYIFCDDERILEVNKQYLQHDYFTDIITFDYSGGKIISGDIFISMETVSSNSKELNVDFNQELYRIIIHGILHLTGQDDKNPESKKEMTRKENEALNLLNFEGI